MPRARSVDGVVNVASVKHRSLFRYPGGKTWLVPHIRCWLASRSTPLAEFVEPFAGGGIVGLSVLFDELAPHITLIEKDINVGAVWQTLVDGQGLELAERIMRFEVTEAAVRQILDSQPATTLDRAFATIVRNRMQRGGILAEGASLMKSGENGHGLLSRWYPETLRKRILDIHALRSRIRFIPGDGLAYLREHSARPDIAWLIDPPYTVAGRRLYAHSTIDHAELFRLTAALTGDFLMTYDNAPPIVDLARDHGFDTQLVPMKSTHHAVMQELLIGRDLDWSRDHSK